MVREDRRVARDDPRVGSIHDHPRRAPERRNRVDVPTSGQVRPGDVRDAHGSVVRNQGDRRRQRVDASRRDVLTAAQRRHPDGSRPRPDEQRDGRAAHEHRSGRGRLARRSDAPDPEDGRRDEERDDRSEAVVAGIRHRAEVGQAVREQLRNRDQGESRREDEEEQERQAQPDDVDEVVSLEQRRRDDARIGEEHPQHAVRRAPDFLVEAVEDAVLARERAHDHVHGDERPRGTRERDRRPGDTTAAREGEPDPQPHDRQAHELARRHRQRGADREREQSIRVEEPDAEEKERNGERDRVDGRDRRDREPRVGEVAEREETRRPLRAEMTAREPEHGKRARRDGDDLGESEHER